MSTEPTPNADEALVLKNAEEIKALIQNIITQLAVLLKKIG